MSVPEGGKFELDGAGTIGGGWEVSGNGTALDLGDAPEPDELLLVLLRRLGDCDGEPEEVLVLSLEGDLLLFLGEIDLDFDCGGVSSFSILLDFPSVVSCSFMF